MEAWMWSASAGSGRRRRGCGAADLERRRSSGAADLERRLRPHGALPRHATVPRHRRPQGKMRKLTDCILTGIDALLHVDIIFTGIDSSRRRSSRHGVLQERITPKGTTPRRWPWIKLLRLGLVLVMGDEEKQGPGSAWMMDARRMSGG